MKAIPLSKARRMAHAAAIDTPKDASVGYYVTDAGLFFRSGAESAPVKLSGPFKIVARTRMSDGTGWGLLLRWADADGRSHVWSMPAALLAGDGAEVRRYLMSRGLYITTGQGNRNRLIEYLAGADVPDRARCVDRTGWDGDTFILPGAVFGGDDTLIVYQTEGTPPEYRTTGTLADWQARVAALAVGNSRLALALCCAFAGPLLGSVGEDSFGLHFHGGSSIGKTTITFAGASVWGSDVGTWRATDNGAETVAAGANDTLLCLDEISQADGRVVDALSYMLGNGRGKARAAKTMTTRPALVWHLVFLSTGEQTMADKLAEVGRRARAGQAVRMIEVPAGAGAGLGIWESLHGFESGAALSAHVRRAAEEHRGTAAHAYLKELAANRTAAARVVEAYRDAWVEEFTPPGADGQVVRVARRFGLLAAAGELAAKWGIVPWPEGTAAKAAAACFCVWMEARGGIGSAERAEAVEQVRAFIERHGASRFASIDAADANEPIIRDRAGWRRRDASGRWEYLVPATAWKKDVCGGINPRLAADALVDAGYLRPDAQGKRSRAENIPGHGKVRVYVLSADLMTDV